MLQLITARTIEPKEGDCLGRQERPAPGSLFFLAKSGPYPSTHGILHAAWYTDRLKAGMKPISLLLADDHNVVREGLRVLLSAEPDMEIVGEASNGWQAVKLVKQTQPGIVIMDLAMPALNGLEATRHILQEQPSTKIIILTSYSDEDYVKQMVEAGVAGYLKKQTAAQDLVKAIREVHRGNVFFSPSIARGLCDQARASGSVSGRRQPLNQLTSREVQVLRLIAQGAANKQMAADLGISVKTVEKHRQHLMKKLGIHDIAGLTRYAAEKGIIHLGPEPEVEKNHGVEILHD